MVQTKRGGEVSRDHYDFCLRRGTNGSDWEECNCYEFDRALEWVSPYLREQIAREIEAETGTGFGSDCECVNDYICIGHRAAAIARGEK